ncbi:MAG TPA: twin-arginine translocase subunit TatC [Vicinamibacteria bacterium]|nr:twin-arginine translocase subunit TatC [Vicinamibacteria bacterium]HRB11566.1 twin-arginine translocase subunit TatC [Vicinamibacteria bacterium]
MAKEDPEARMSFLDHLEELRSRLLKSLIALAVGFGVAWGYHEEIFHFMVTPLKRANPTLELIATTPTEAIMLYMKMSFFVGIFIAAPFLLYQVWAFISPGLYTHEKGYAIPFVMFGTAFFVTGAAFGHYYLFPVTLKFLGEFGGQDIKFMPRITEYYDFYSWFLLALGIVFQVPVIIFVLARIGLVTAGFLLRQFKWAVLLSFIVAAVVTPTPDIVTQTLLALPMVGLYLLGVVVAAIFGKKRQPAS